jgi:hypothetical protein
MSKSDEFQDAGGDGSSAQVQEMSFEAEKKGQDDSLSSRTANVLNVSVCRQNFSFYTVFRFQVELLIELGWHSTTVELYEIVGGARTWIASMSRDSVEPMPPPGMGKRERWSATTFANSGANRNFEVDAFLYRFQDQTVSKGITAGPNTIPCPP